MASTQISSNEWEFARILPHDEAAENALDRVYDDPKLSEHHRSFIHVEHKQRSEDSGSESSSSKRDAAPPSQFWAGYYSLSLEDPAKSKTTVGWRLGRGNPAADDETRGVDILLIRPKSKSHNVAPIHARIQFHERSGVLMLVGLHQERPIRYWVHDESSPISLANGQRHVLYQKSNHVSVGSLSYDIAFRDFNPDQYAQFLRRRNLLLYGAELHWPHMQISAIPRPEDVKRGLVVTHGTIGYGRFGRVSPGVHIRTGMPIAIKQHQPTNAQEMHAIRREVTIGRQLGVSTRIQNLLSIFD
ncbi:MAG: hypothetical protein Q9220_007616 [cf. Caloplaca sp. 1 TL-2023]